VGEVTEMERVGGAGAETRWLLHQELCRLSYMLEEGCVYCCRRLLASVSDREEPKLSRNPTTEWALLSNLAIENALPLPDNREDELSTFIEAAS
jgi:hypothetical protein